MVELYITGAGQVSITNTDFVSNSAVSKDDENGYGGAIYNFGTISDVSGSNFYNNQAHVGGAIVNNGSITSLSANFVNNTSSSGGGAIYNFDVIGDTSDLTATALAGTFKGNVANPTAYKSGGAIYNQGATITKINAIFGGAGSGSYNGVININNGSTNIGGNYVFNNVISGNNINIYNGANITLGSKVQADITTSYGYLNALDLVVDNNGGTINQMNNNKDTNTLNSITIGSSGLNYKIDYDFAGGADTIKTTINSTGLITISDINILNSTTAIADGFKVKILDTPADTLKLALTAATKNLGTGDFSYDNVVTASTNWSTEIRHHELTGATKTANFSLATTTTTYDSIAASITYTGGSEVKSGDTMAAVIQAITPADRAFIADSSDTYNVGADLGALGGTSLVVDGGSIYNAAIAGGTYTGITVYGGQTLTFQNIGDVTGFSGDAITNEGIFNVIDSKITSGINNSESLNLKASEGKIVTIDGAITDKTTPEGVLTIGGAGYNGTVNLNGNVTQDTLNLNSGSLNLGSSANLNIANFNTTTSGLSLDLQNGVYNDSIDLGVATLSDSLNLEIDIAAGTTPTGDSITVDAGSSGVFNIDSIYFSGVGSDQSTIAAKVADGTIKDFDLQILNGNDVNTSLTMDSTLKSKFDYDHTDDIDHQETIAPASANIVYTDNYGTNHYNERTVRGLDLYDASSSGVNNAIKLTTTVSKVNQNLDKEDNLAVLNKYSGTGYTDRSIDFTGIHDDVVTQGTYTMIASTDLGTTTAGKMTLNGVMNITGDTRTTVDMNSNAGYNLTTNATELVLKNLELKNASSDTITVGNSGSKVTLDNSVVDGNINGSSLGSGVLFDLTTSNVSEITGDVTKANIANSGDLTLGGNVIGKYTQSLAAASLTLNDNALLTLGSGSSISAGKVDIESGSTMDVGTGANVVLDGDDGLGGLTNVDWAGNVTLNGGTLTLSHIVDKTRVTTPDDPATYNKTGKLIANTGNLTINSGSVLLGFQDKIADAVVLTTYADIYVGTGSEMYLTGNEWADGKITLAGGTLGFNGATTSGATKALIANTGSLGLTGAQTTLTSNLDTIAKAVVVNVGSDLVINNANVSGVYLNGDVTSPVSADTWTSHAITLTNGNLTLDTLNVSTNNSTGYNYNQTNGTLNLVDSSLTLNSGSKISGSSTVTLNASSSSTSAKLIFNNGEDNATKILMDDATSELTIKGLDSTHVTTLMLNTDSAIDNGKITVGDGNNANVLKVHNNSTIAAAVDVDIKDKAILDIAGTGDLILNNDDTWSGKINQTGGKITVLDVSTKGANAVLVSNGGRVNIGQTTPAASGILALNNADDYIYKNTKVTILEGSRLNQSAGNVILDNDTASDTQDVWDGIINLTGGNLTLSGRSDMTTENKKFKQSGGAVTIKDGSSLTLNNADSSIMNGATVNLGSATPASIGSLIVNTSSTVNNNAAIVTNGASVFDLKSGSKLATATGTNIASAAQVTVAGAFDIAAGNVTLNTGDAWSGDVTVSTGNLTVLNNIAKTGTLKTTGGNLVIGDDDTTDTDYLNLNQSTDEIVAAANVTIYQDGVLNQTAGKATLNAADTWYGAISLGGCTLTLDGRTENLTGTVQTYSQSAGILNLQNGTSLTLANAVNKITGGNVDIKGASSLILNNEQANTAQVVTSDTSANVLTLGTTGTTLKLTGNTEVNKQATITIGSNTILEVNETTANGVNINGGSTGTDSWAGEVVVTGGVLNISENATKTGTLTQTSGSGTTNVTDTFTITTGDSITAGTLNIGDGVGTNDSTLNVTGGTITSGDGKAKVVINSDATMNITGGTVTLNGGSGTHSQVDWKGIVALGDGGTLILDNIYDSTRSAAELAGNTANKSGKLNAAGGNLAINANTVVLGSDDIIADNVALTLLTDNLYVGTGSAGNTTNVYIGTDDSWSGSINLTTSGTLTLDGTTTATGTNNVNATGGTLNLVNTGTTGHGSATGITLGSTADYIDYATATTLTTDLNINAGHVQLNGSGTGADTLTNAGTISQHDVILDGGTLHNTGSMTSNSTFKNEAPSTIDNSATEGAGTLNVNDGYNKGSITQGNITIANGNTGFDNDKTINVETKLDNKGTFNNNKDVAVANSTNDANLTNTGTINSTANSTITTDTLTNHSGSIDGTINLTNATVAIVYQADDIKGVINVLGTDSSTDTTDLAIMGAKPNFAGNLNVGNSTNQATLNLMSGNVLEEAVTNIASGSVLNVDDSTAPGTSSVVLNTNDTYSGDLTLASGTVTMKDINVSTGATSTTSGGSKPYYQQTGGTLNLQNATLTMADSSLISNPTNSTDLNIDKNSVFNSQSNAFNVENLTTAGLINGINGGYENYAVNTTFSVGDGVSDNQADFTFDLYARSNANKNNDSYGSNSDTIVATNGTDGVIYISDWQLNGDLFGYDAPIDRNISFDDLFKGIVAPGQTIKFTSTDKEVFTPIGWFRLNSKGGGNYSFDLERYNPGVFRGQITSIAQYQNQLAIDDVIFGHTMLDQGFKGNDYIVSNPNRYASANDLYAPYQYSRKDGGIWLKTYGTFEKLNMNHGLKVGNNAYGTLTGVDYGLKDLKHGWQFMPTAYVGYNGAHQYWNGYGAYQNGGQAGFLDTWYKNNFMIGTMAYGGVYGNQMDTPRGTDDTFNYFAGSSVKTAYNWKIHKDWAIQPNLLFAYNFFGKENWHSDFGQMGMMSGMLHGINIAPGLNLICEKETFSLYATIQYIYNVNQSVGGRAGNVQLPGVHVDRGYLQYGLGFNKKFSDRFSGFFQVVIHNVGRNGVGLQMGFNWTFGESKKTNSLSERTVIKQTHK